MTATIEQLANYFSRFGSEVGFRGLGQRITKARECLNLSVAEFATAGNVDFAMQEDYECNRALPSIGYFANLHRSGLCIGRILLNIDAFESELCPERMANIDRQADEWLKTCEEVAGQSFVGDQKIVMFESIRYALILTANKSNLSP